jgi:hypothetical protein
MDELEQSASAHCSHLSKASRDWLVFMIDLLAEMGDEIPSYPTHRYALYKKNKIPEQVYLQFDGEAVHKAMGKIHGDRSERND